MTASSANHDVLKDEIRSAIRKVTRAKVDPDILSKCVATAATLQLSAETVGDCWDAVSATHNFKELNQHTFKTLREEMIKQSDDNVIPPTTSSGTAIMTTPKTTKSPEQVTSSHSVVTPAPKPNPARKISLSPMPPILASMESSRKKMKYDERQGVGTVVATYQPDLAVVPITTSPDAPRCTIQWDTSTKFPTNVTQPYRHLFTPLSQKAQALEQHMQKMTRVLEDAHAFGQGDLASLEAVGLPGQDLVCNIGRICSSAHEGRMNSTTVMLEGSRVTSGGARVEVDLRHLKSDYSLFPGQIVAIEGYNTTGRSLVAQRLCEGAPHPPNQSKAADLLRFHYHVQDGTPLQIVTAAGPFTTADNLEYQPLVDFISYLVQQEPDVVILTGPFVDMRHTTVASGNTVVDGSVVPSEVLFAHRVAQVLEDFYEGASHATQFVLQPSTDDATAEWVFPQPPFQDRLYEPQNSNTLGSKEFELGTMGLSYVETMNRGDNSSYRRVHCIPNPCTLCINEVVVGVTSTDVLFHTSTNETNGNLPAGTRLARIAQHMLQQRNYYPLFPAQVNLDWQQSWEMPCRPDVLVCPSKLSSFAKAVMDSTLVVNPGPLVRDTTGGTYAVLQVHPLPRETLEASAHVEIAHNVAQRTRVEVKRI